MKFNNFYLQNKNNEKLKIQKNTKQEKRKATYRDIQTLTMFNLAQEIKRMNFRQRFFLAFSILFKKKFGSVK